MNKCSRYKNAAFLATHSFSHNQKTFSYCMCLNKELHGRNTKYCFIKSCNVICDINSMTLTLVNMYAPYAHQLYFFNKLLKTIHKCQQGCLLLCREFNITLDLVMESTSFHGRSVPSLQRSIQSHDLYDAWHCSHASERDFTFFSNPHRSYIHINLFLLDK